MVNPVQPPYPPSGEGGGPLPSGPGGQSPLAQYSAAGGQAGAPTPPGPASGPLAGSSGAGYDEPPAPTPQGAPPNPFNAGGTISGVAVTKDNYVYFNLTIPTTSSWWEQVYTYRGQITPQQAAQLQAAGYTPSSLEGLFPPPTYSCQAASNQLTHFPSNMNQFSTLFPEQYQKFVQAFELGIFMQVNSQQTESMQQIKQTMQEMAED